MNMKDWFAGGSLTIRQVFDRLVSRNGVLPDNRPAVGAADPGYMPADDILGCSRPAGGAPDIDACERPEAHFQVYFPLEIKQEANRR
jgi:hypothetical protein